MFTRMHLRIATIAGVALTLAAQLPASAGTVRPSSVKPALTGNPVARAKRLFAPPPRQRMPLGGRHHAGPLETSYTIDDIGAPSRSSIELEEPTMFNNSGQIAGAEYNRQNDIASCIAFTGSRWVRFAPPSLENCAPASMTNANPSSGAFSIVGAGYPAHIDNRIAFATTISGNSVVFHTYRGNVPSELDGINNAGSAVGYSYYRPAGGFFENYPPFVLNGKRFHPLQPQCTTDEPLCMSDVTTDASVGSCPFGGCAINDANVVFGDDYESGWFYEVYTLGQPGSGENLPLAYNTTYPVGLNNNLQISYGDVSSGYYAAWQYQVGASAPISLGALPGSSCAEYYPLGQNNTGEVLGYAFDCVSQSPTYWTWDPVNGMQDLDIEIPPNSYESITPYGVNDAGQVLVSLDSSGTTHWGTLVPSGSAHRAR